LDKALAHRGELQVDRGLTRSSIQKTQRHLELGLLRVPEGVQKVIGHVAPGVDPSKIVALTAGIERMKGDGRDGVSAVLKAI
jgi:hypothetical protein